MGGDGGGGGGGGGGSAGGGGDGGFMEHQKNEEARKQRLRSRVNRLYGLDADLGPAPSQDKFTRKETKVIPGSDRPTGRIVGGGDRSTPPAEGLVWTDFGEGYGGWSDRPTGRIVGGGDRSTPPAEGLVWTDFGEGYGGWVDRPTGRIVGGPSTVDVDVPDVDAYNKAIAEYEADRGTAASARALMNKEEDDLAKASRDFYLEDIKHNFDAAKRRNTFALADRGLLGGSAQVDTERELDRDNTLAATRMEDEIRAAVAGLRNQRESERLNATQIINAGGGEEAIEGAKAGLSRAFENAAATRKASLASDLFKNTADNVALANQMAYGPAALAAYRNAVRTFYNTGTVSGRTTGTG